MRVPSAEEVISNTDYVNRYLEMPISLCLLLKPNKKAKIFDS